MNTKGFTLIELLIVMAIVGILATTLIPNLLSAREQANNTATIGFVRNTINAIESERDLFGFIPSNTIYHLQCGCGRIITIFCSGLHYYLYP